MSSISAIGSPVSLGTRQAGAFTKPEGELAAMIKPSQSLTIMDNFLVRTSSFFIFVAAAKASAIDFCLPTSIRISASFSSCLTASSRAFLIRVQVLLKALVYFWSLYTDNTSSASASSSSTAHSTISESSSASSPLSTV